METINALRSLFFEEADLFLSIYDKDLNCLDINEAFLKLFRCERKDLVGKNLCEISPDLKESGRYDLYKEVIRSGNPITIDRMQPHPYIGNYHFRIRVFKVGEGLGLLVKDITDLVESIERFTCATNASREIIYEWDLNNNSFWFNEAFYDIVGVKKTDNSQTINSWLACIHPMDTERVKKYHEDFLNSQEKYWSIDYRVRARNNSTLFFAERAFVIRDRAGKPAKIIASVADVTHWQLNIKHLEEILFALSHKVRQPVANILGIANLLDNEHLNEEELKKIVGYMKVSVNSLDSFIKDMTHHILTHKETSENNNPS